MSITKIKVGRTVPLEGDNPLIKYSLNFGSPHMIISKSVDGKDLNIFQTNSQVLTNSDKIVFDSYHFDYLRIDQAIAFSINLPSRVGTYTDGGKKGSSYWTPVAGATTYFLGLHGRADVPAIFATGNGNILSSALYGYGNSLRTITIYATSSGIYLKESYIAVQTEIPASTLNGVVYVLKSSLTSSTGNYTPSIYGLYTNSARTIFGQGKFDSDYNYVYTDPSGFKLTRQSSFRTKYGFRLGNPGYTSSWNNSFSVMQDGAAVYNVNNITIANNDMIDLVPETSTGSTMGISVP